MKVLAKINIKNKEGKHLIDNIHGIKDGSLVIGDYDEDTGNVKFKWHKQNAVINAKDTCDIVEYEQKEFVVAKRPSIYAAATTEDFFDNLADALEFKEKRGGYLFYGIYWIDAKAKDNIKSVRQNCARSYKPLKS